MIAEIGWSARHMNTKIIGVSVENDKIVIHEMFDGYRKK